MVMVELNGVGESSGARKGAGGDPEGFLSLEDPLVVWCEGDGAVCGRKWAKLTTSVSGGYVTVVFCEGCGVWANRCKWQVE